jgi:hypothetical protein
MDITEVQFNQLLDQAKAALHNPNLTARETIEAWLRIFKDNPLTRNYSTHEVLAALSDAMRAKLEEE